MNWQDNAVLSIDGKHRYQLQRELRAHNTKVCLFIMLNPSTADGMSDDPTLRRCKSFADGLRCGRLEVVNLFSFRATDPSELRGKPLTELIGPQQWQYFLEAVKRADVVICGWGADKMAVDTGRTVGMFLASSGSRPMCLGTTKNGAPKHPLYVKGGTPLVPWRCGS